MLTLVHLLILQSDPLIMTNSSLIAFLFMLFLLNACVSSSGSNAHKDTLRDPKYDGLIIQFSTPNLKIKAPLRQSGDFIQSMIEAVMESWERMRRITSVDRTGRFRGSIIMDADLHPDGFFTNLRILQSHVPPEAEIQTRQALLTVTGLPPWSNNMKTLIGQNPIPVEITFTYDYRLF